jgi:hypothetical protein
VNLNRLEVEDFKSPSTAGLAAMFEFVSNNIDTERNVTPSQPDDVQVLFH